MGLKLDPNIELDYFKKEGDMLAMWQCQERLLHENQGVMTFH